MSSEYIIDRLLPRIVTNLCRKHDIELTTLSDDWLLKLSQDDETHWIVGYQFDINSGAGLRIAEDKVATYLILSSNNMPAIKHLLVKSVPQQEPDLSALASLPEHASYVLKPLTGSGGRNVTKHDSLSAVIEAIHASNLPNLSVSPWVDIVSEKRLIVLDSDVLFAFEKVHTGAADDFKLFNLGQGAKPVVFTPTDHERALALSSVKACSLRLAAVDIVTLENGEQHVLELNSGVMLEHFARYSDENYSIAQSVYEKIILSAFGNR